MNFVIVYIIVIRKIKRGWIVIKKKKNDNKNLIVIIEIWVVGYVKKIVFIVYCLLVIKDVDRI